MTSPTRQRIYRMVPSGVVLAAVMGLLVVAHYFDSLPGPVKPKPCLLKTTTGIPCAACGGTRCFMALSHGEWGQAAQFNPGAMLGVVAAAGWFGISLVRTLRASPAELQAREAAAQGWSRGKVWLVTGSVLGIVALNWVYLIFFLEDAGG